MLAECNAAVSTSQRIRQGVLGGEDDATKSSSAMNNFDTESVTTTTSTLSNFTDHASVSGERADDEGELEEEDEEECISQHSSVNADAPAMMPNGPMVTAATTTTSLLNNGKGGGRLTPNSSSNANATDHDRGGDGAVTSSSTSVHGAVSSSIVNVCSSASLAFNGNGSNTPSSLEQSYAQKYINNKYPLITTNGSGNSKGSTYSSISSILRNKYSKANNTSDHNNRTNELASYKSLLTSSGKCCRHYIQLHKQQLAKFCVYIS